MKRIIYIGLFLFFYSVQILNSQNNLKVEEAAMECVEKSFKMQGADVYKLIKGYEEYLIAHQVLNSTSAQGYRDLSKLIIEPSWSSDEIVGFSQYIQSVIKSKHDMKRESHNCLNKMLVNPHLFDFTFADSIKAICDSVLKKYSDDFNFLSASKKLFDELPDRYYKEPIYKLLFLFKLADYGSLTNVFDELNNESQSEHMIEQNQELIVILSADEFYYRQIVSKKEKYKVVIEKLFNTVDNISTLKIIIPEGLNEFSRNFYVEQAELVQKIKRYQESKALYGKLFSELDDDEQKQIIQKIPLIQLEGDN